MNWEKLGLIYSPPLDGSWKDNSALTPTPFLLNDQVIRVYASFRDPNGVGRIGFVDVDANDPLRVVRISENPALDIGDDGMFDDNGVILGDLLRLDNEIRMYYVGFQLVHKAKFLAYTGLAVSKDNGETFKRMQKTPILDRSECATCFNAIHTILFENGVYRAWCGTGSAWNEINGVQYPNYITRHYESKDGVNFNTSRSIVCIAHKNNEYRIGRPRVFKLGGKYNMLYTFGTLDGRYEIGYARSSDGLDWEREDDSVGIGLSENGWDSQSISYGAPIETKKGVFMFYNGNNMGRDGFGCAKLN